MATGDGNYVLIEDVDIWPDGMDDTEKGEVIARAEDKVEKACKDFFYSKPLDDYFSGNGRSVLDLGLTSAILTVTSVEIYDASGDLVTTVTLSDITWSFSALRGRVWPRGSGNIRVQGTIGWAATPAMIEKAAKILVEYELDPTLYDEVQQGTVREGATSYTRSTRVLTGVLQADELLWPYALRARTYIGVV